MLRPRSSPRSSPSSPSGGRVRPAAQGPGPACWWRFRAGPIGGPAAGGRAWADGAGPLAAAHLNHRLRTGDADRDEALCAGSCAAGPVPLAHVARADPRPVARERGRGLEEAGRHLRLAFLEVVLDRSPGLHAAATGHHRDDQTETVIMRLLRGTGPDGLRGIRPVSGRIIHPLLGVGRATIAAGLAAAALASPGARTRPTPAATTCGPACGGSCCRWPAASSGRAATRLPPGRPAGRRPRPAGWADRRGPGDLRRR